MKFISNKYLGRYKLIAGGSIFNLIGPFGNILLSTLFIRFTSATFYGAIASILILIDFVFNIISWGNKEFLIREFSKSPSRINKLWSQSFANRIPLLILFALLIPFLAESTWEGIALLIWIISRYVYRSYDAHIQFNKTFPVFIFIELFGLTILVIPLIILKNEITKVDVIVTYSISTFVKMVLTILFFRRKVTLLKKVSFSPVSYLASVFPFLLLTLSGLFQAKADVYGVALFMPLSDLAQYQVMSGFLGFVLMIAYLVLFPFANNLYRISKSTMKKIKQKLFVFGMIISAVAIAFIFLVMKNIYHFNFSPAFYLLCYFYLIPKYLYISYFYEYTKNNFQKQIVFFTIASGIINFLLSLLLIGYFMKEGAIAAAAIAEWILYFLYATKFGSGKFNAQKTESP